ncbi:hypothetical protein O7634_01705 [Micromonospora sp. WMMD1120]|uniref:hypothetical protein n=1 Tax=Micromonospora sp. WMMD1120 TaxID=3016106 RepID=UPI002416B7F6|nr:hypothetical protein [Micromonospora sp. WMMD1120]MDG4805475.1 hypothetical protein [Micromonospora sp. WMMD1120]
MEATDGHRRLRQQSQPVFRPENFCHVGPFPGRHPKLAIPVQTVLDARVDLRTALMDERTTRSVRVRRPIAFSIILLPDRGRGLTLRCDRRGMAARTFTKAGRISASLAAAMLVSAGLTACTPVIKGRTGATVDAAGQPLAVLAWCADRPPGTVRFFAERDSISPSPSDVSTSADWPYWPGRDYAVPRAATSPTTVRLTGFLPDPAPRPYPAFRMYGVASDSSFTTHSVTFRLAELEDLTPGTVLITEIVENDDVRRSVSMEEFARLGKDEC